MVLLNFQKSMGSWISAAKTPQLFTGNERIMTLGANLRDRDL